ncbi:MAG TPA: methyltransferase [Pirellulales bacterium]
MMLKALSIIGYLGMVGGLLALLLTGNLFTASPLVIVVQVLAVSVFLWARVAFGLRSYHVVANPTAGGLVTHGPYRYIRHPIYTAMCLFTWAGIVGHWSWCAALCGVLVLASALLRIYCEEILVTVRYPEYAQYKTETWRMVPFVF